MSVCACASEDSEEERKKRAKFVRYGSLIASKRSEIQVELKHTKHTNDTATATVAKIKSTNKKRNQLINEK